MLLKGKVVLLTDATTVMGRALAFAFGREGARIVAIAPAHLSEHLRALAVDMQEQGGEAATAAIELVDANGASRLIETALKAFGRLDVLVAVMDAGRAADEGKSHDLCARVDSLALCAQAALSQMKAQRQGVILVVGAAAQAGLSGVEEGMAQGAAHALTRIVASEAAPYGVRVNAIAPGLLGDEVSGAHQEERGSLEAAIPLGRLGTPDDIAGLAVFLCSDLASFITGEILHVDGGWPFSKPLSPGGGNRASTSGGS